MKKSVGLALFKSKATNKSHKKNPGIKLQVDVFVDVKEKNIWEKQ